MSFNHRVMRHRDPDGTFVYQIHEVFYADDGKVEGWSSGPAMPCGESLGELMRDLQHMRDALALPVLCAKRGKDVEPPLSIEAIDAARSADLNRRADLFAAGRVDDAARAFALEGLTP